MIRTRFAPSPTGFLHIGGLKTALFSYLFAKHNNGKFTLRIEDTDQNRYVEGGVEQIIWSLKWGNVCYDEGPDVGGDFGPYIQTQRKEIYQNYIKELIDKGFAYYCFCTAERLEEMRKKQEQYKMPPKYDRNCLDLSKEEIEQKIKNGDKYVIRMKVPADQWIVFNDLIKGEIKFNSNEVDDQVLIKSDGLPTYHFAVVIDDHLMQITHIIRGDEWVSSTPKQILLYKAFGWDVPQFAHVPPILAPDGKKKLSKREGSVSVNEFYKLGYTPEGVINYLALLGWNPGTTEEIFSMQDLIEKFSLERCQKAGARFDIDRLDWVNGQHIRRMSLEEFDQKISEYMINFRTESQELRAKNLEIQMFTRFLMSEKERINKFSEIDDDMFILDFKKDYDVNGIYNEKMNVTEENINEILSKSLDFIKNTLVVNYNTEKKVEEENIKQQFVEFIGGLGLKNGQVLWPIRYVLSGKEKSAGVFELIWILGIEESVKRIEVGMEKVERA